MNLDAKGLCEVADVSGVRRDHGYVASSAQSGRSQRDGCVDDIGGAGSSAEQTGRSGDRAIQRDLVAVTKRP